MASLGMTFFYRTSKSTFQSQTTAGRPVGVTDGALYVTDDGSRSIWRVTYTGK
jgi:glucose/arabinose dehydrogenase